MKEKIRAQVQFVLRPRNVHGCDVLQRACTKALPLLIPDSIRWATRKPGMPETNRFIQVKAPRSGPIRLLPLVDRAVDVGFNSIDRRSTARLFFFLAILRSIRPNCTAHPLARSSRRRSSVVAGSVVRRFCSTPLACKLFVHSSRVHQTPSC